MLPLFYFLAAAVSFLALGIAGVVATRHFVVVILAIELMFAGSIVALVGFFDYATIIDGSFFIILLSIWTVANVEIIGLIAFYTYMRNKIIDFDLRKLMQLKG
jgi:NADH:ubiquinone oxidoreductase subunit K